MAGLNMGIISALPVLLPSVSQQREIVDRFRSLRSECSQLEEIERRHLSALEELKQSMLQKALSGEMLAYRQNDLAEAVA